MYKAVPVGAHASKEKCARELPLTAPALWVRTAMLDHVLNAPSNDPSLMPEGENLFRREHPYPYPCPKRQRVTKELVAFPP